MQSVDLPNILHGQRHQCDLLIYNLKVDSDFRGVSGRWERRSGRSPSAPLFFGAQIGRSAVKRRHLLAGANPARQLSFQPVAIGAGYGGNDMA